MLLFPPPSVPICASFSLFLYIAPAPTALQYSPAKSPLHYYAATEITFQCIFIFNTAFTDPDLSMSVSWLRDNTPLSMNDKLDFDTTPTSFNYLHYTARQDFEYIAVSDEGTYSCDLLIFSTLGHVNNHTEKSNEITLSVTSM